MTRTERTNGIVLTGLLMALITVCTMFIKLPTPSGYVHLGTMVVFLAVAILGKKLGIIAGAVGTALADLLSGYALWSPGSLLIMFFTVLVYSFFIDKSVKKNGGIPRGFDVNEVIGILLAGLIMVGGYYIYGSLLFYGWAAGLLQVIPNTMQFIVGIVLARIIGTALCHTSGKKVFTYKYIKVEKKAQ